MTRIKFCGLTREADIDLAIELSVDAVGFVFWPKSPRALSLDAARDLVRRLPSTIAPVGVFVEPTRDEIAEAITTAGIRVAQVHAMTNPSSVCGLCELWVATSPEGPLREIPKNVMILLDATDEERHGGTGQRIDWAAARRITATRRVMLAGGLTAQNVGEAIRRAQPFGVDVSSGIEERPGVKNAKLMRDFVSAVQHAAMSADLRSAEGDNGD